MDWSGVDYCDVFISCLDSHSDGTHSLPLVSKWWNATFLQIWWRNKLISNGLRVRAFPANFWVNYYFNNFLIFKKKSHCSLWKTTFLSVGRWMFVSGVNHSQECLMLAQNEHSCGSDQAFRLVSSGFWNVNTVSVLWRMHKWNDAKSVEKIPEIILSSQSPASANIKTAGVIQT